ncbi:restriction endonuclease [Streptomyces virginiae]|uniref:restriction endonuclease n=1 Tax=Streptomyces virginiae TaxID=1961 RepID=UPI0036BF3EB1
MTKGKRNGRPWNPIRADTDEAHDLAAFLRAQVDASGKTLAALAQETNFSSSMMSVSLSGAIPKVEFIKALITATERSPGLRSKKIEHALNLHRKALSARHPRTNKEEPVGEAEIIAKLITSLEEQITLERELRTAMQINWLLLAELDRRTKAPTIDIDISDTEEDDPPHAPTSTKNGAPGGERQAMETPIARRRYYRTDVGAAGLAHPGKPHSINLKELSGHEFEKLIATLFNSMENVSWVTEGPRDAGVDAVVINDDPVFGGVTLVQVKHRREPISTPLIHTFSSVVDSERASKGIVVTSGKFTGPAKEFAARHSVELLDGEMVQHLVKEHLNIDLILPE